MTLISRRKQRDQNKMESYKRHVIHSAPLNPHPLAVTGTDLTTLLAAGLYVASGVTQPLLMTMAKNAGLADPTAQLYMFFYYIGPASVSLSLRQRRGQRLPEDGEGRENEWPSRSTLIKASSIAAIDIIAQSMNYSGTTLSGPTVFAIIYSSVTVWTAVYSRFLLKRYLNTFQWIGVATVFWGLALTALHSVTLGKKVFVGSCLILVGSSVHAMTYVVSELIMTNGEVLDRIGVRANCAVQGLVACGTILIWQLLYTRTQFDKIIGQPMTEAGTTWLRATMVFGSIALANFIHSLSFFHTIRHFPGGAVSAGVMKGLQAVLVFIFTAAVFCGHTGGDEMCFTSAKLLSLFVVVGGVLVYGKATETQAKGGNLDSGVGNGRGCKSIPDAEIEISLSATV